MGGSAAPQACSKHSMTLQFAGAFLYATVAETSNRQGLLLIIDGGHSTLTSFSQEEFLRVCYYTVFKLTDYAAFVPPQDIFWSVYIGKFSVLALRLHLIIGLKLFDFVSILALV